MTLDAERDHLQVEQERRDRITALENVDTFPANRMMGHAAPSGEQVPGLLRAQTALNMAESAVDERVQQGDHYAGYEARCPYAEDHKRELRRIFSTVAPASESSARLLELALEEIVAVASGERQVANDDAEGMAWIDKRARAALASTQTEGK